MGKTLEMIIRELEETVKELEAKLKARREEYNEQFDFTKRRMEGGGNGDWFGHADAAYSSGFWSGRELEEFEQRELRYHELRNLLIDLKLTPE